MIRTSICVFPFLEVLQAHSGLRLRRKTLPVRSGISGRMKIQLHSLRWWLLGVNQLRGDRTTVRDWMPFGCSPRQALETPIQATSCVFVSAYRKILQLCHFTRREVQSQYKIAEQKKIPGQRQYLALQKYPRSARAMTEYFARARTYHPANERSEATIRHSERYDTCFQQVPCRIAGTKHALPSLHLLTVRRRARNRAR